MTIRNMIIATLAALVMTFGGLVWANSDSRITALEERVAKDGEAHVKEAERMSAVETKVDILLKQVDRLVRRMERDDQDRRR